MPRKKIELLPCPWCSRDMTGESAGVNAMSGWFVECPRCLCHGPYTLIGEHPAEKLWNRRSKPKKKVSKKK
jgi:hypothetical protein